MPLWVRVCICLYIYIYMRKRRRLYTAALESLSKFYTLNHAFCSREHRVYFLWHCNTLRFNYMLSNSQIFGITLALGLTFCFEFKTDHTVLPQEESWTSAEALIIGLCSIFFLHSFTATGQIMSNGSRSFPSLYPTLYPRSSEEFESLLSALR